MTGDKTASYLLKSVAQACKEFGLLVEGDRVAVAVSGGKDSRALLDLLLRYRGRVPFSYELVALHIAGNSVGFTDLRPELEPWFRELGVEYQFAPLELPPEEALPLDCFRCSWNRRKALFTAAVKLGCNKLAFGHNADDAATTTLLNLLFNGRLETMAPRVEFFDGAVTVIRPLIYLPEKELARYGRAAGFPDSPACPQGLASRRAQIKAFLHQFGRDENQIRVNIWRAARRAMGF
jgi:tRNA 2-thiocytidine biosynthesis protein TtcA